MMSSSAASKRIGAPNPERNRTGRVDTLPLPLYTQGESNTSQPRNKEKRTMSIKLTLAFFALPGVVVTAGLYFLAVSVGL